MKTDNQFKKINICVCGLGYVGLPIAVEFAKIFDVVGFDQDKLRVTELTKNYDRTGEISSKQLEKCNIKFVSQDQLIEKCNVFIITVPTPIDNFNKPDLSFLTNASQTISRFLKKNDCVIYESTVYPGVTEDVCLPILEKNSGLQLNNDFWLGYSPERINPGDTKNRLDSIVKITSGSNEEAANFIDKLYSKIVKVGTHKAPSIKVAEAAKVIENIQRDLNIALVNELSMLFKELDLNTRDILKAAGSKWNFIPFEPGLVGGHCIGVDPYYLTHKASEIGFHPELILAGRRTNDSMPDFIAKTLVRHMIKSNKSFVDAPVLILGMTFKENCRDIRNSKVFDLRDKIIDFGLDVETYDRFADPNTVKLNYGFNKVEYLEENKYEAIILAVKHDYIKNMTIKKIRSYGKEDCIIFDLKGMFSDSEIDICL